MRTIIAITLFIALTLADPAPKPAVQYEAPAKDVEAAPKVEAKKEEVKAEIKAEIKKEEIKAEVKAAPAPAVTPIVNIVDVPCDHATPDTDLPRVIYIAAEEEDCTSALKAEVAELELLVDKLTVLLTLKGVQVGTGEECAVPGVKKGDEPKKNGEGTNPGAPGTPGDKDGKTPDKKDDKDGKGKNGEPAKTPEDKNGGGKNPDDKGDKGGKTGDDKKDGKTGDDKKDTTNGGNGGNPGDKGTETTKPTEGGTQGGRGLNRLSTTGSSAAVNTMLTVGLVIGAAVCAGIAAVAIGLFASAAAASAPAVASAAPMAACAVNPLYTPATMGGHNALHV